MGIQCQGCKGQEGQMMSPNDVRDDQIMGSFVNKARGMTQA